MAAVCSSPTRWVAPVPNGKHIFHQATSRLPAPRGRAFFSSARAAPQKKPENERTTFPPLTSSANAARYALRTFLPDGVMVAQVTLTHPVMVRIHVGQPVGKRSEIIGGSVKLRANPLYFRGDTNSLHLTELGRISPLRFGHARKSSISAGYLFHRSNFFDGQSGQKLLPSSVKTGLKRSVSQR